MINSPYVFFSFDLSLFHVVSELKLIKQKKKKRKKRKIHTEYLGIKLSINLIQGKGLFLIIVCIFVD